MAGQHEHAYPQARSGQMSNNTKTVWRVLGLWQVWDDLPDAPAPQERPPEALLERLVGTFDRRPSEAEAERAVIEAGTTIRLAFENREMLGHAILEDAAWKRVLNKGGWLPEGTRRHPPGGRHSRLLALAYDLTSPSKYRDRQVELWAPAPERGGPRLEDVAARLRSIGDSMGLPPVEFGPEVPFFEGRQPAPERRRRRSRDRDIGL